MAKRVLVHRADSIYDDRPDTQYQFPSQYLSRMKPCEGDWVVCYEPRKGGGRLGYNAIAKVQEIIPDPSLEGMYLAVIEAGSFLPLEQFVPYQIGATYLESDLDAGDGSLIQGKMQSAVRPISDADFLRILQTGIPDSDAVLPRQDDQGGLAEPEEAFEFEFERPVVEQLITRKVRDRVFRTKILQAYDSRCAITGMNFINGKGRAEVEAAHIKPVQANGSDSIQNGLALSGTVHWMFDRGMISLSDNADILVSRFANDPDRIWALVNSSKKASFPATSALRPHLANLAWHRENCFKD